jgi:hypothetical protein
VDLDRVGSRELVERLWEDVRRREALLSSLPEVSAPELSFSIALRYLNLNWERRVIDLPFAGSRKLRHRVARRFVRLMTFVLEPVLAQDEHFRAHQVRVANEAAEAHDQLLREVRLLRAALEDRAARITERIDTIGREIEDRLAALEERVIIPEPTT